MPDPVNFETVTQLVRAAKKYQDIEPGLVATLAKNEIARGWSEKEAVKRVKRKLHQMVGAYVDTRYPYHRWLEDLRGAADQEARKRVCLEILMHHASTRERVPELEEIYARIFEQVGTPRSVLDLACGLNPMSRPLMPLPAEATYVAVDVHGGLVRFLNEAMPLIGSSGHAFAHDLLSGPPAIRADLVLLLKTLPCLEQADRRAGLRILTELQAPVVIVSYPTTSLGGSDRGMKSFYRERFMEIVPPGRFEIEALTFSSELAFVLRSRGEA
jgi:16S rRNA (guanine(1405)-N(7))-methyltransferase